MRLLKPILCTSFLGLSTALFAQIFPSSQSASSSLTNASANLAAANTSVLMQIKLFQAQGKHEVAEKIASSYLENHNQDVDIRLRLGLIQMQQKKYPQAQQNFELILAKYPNYTEARVGLNKIKSIKKAPITVDKKSTPHHSLARPTKSKNYIPPLPPTLIKANEIGFFTDNAYVADLHSIWDYSSVYYMRDTSTGRVGGRVNYASRRGYSAPQFELDYFPRLSQNLYLDLAVAASSQPALFPQRMARAEGYFKANSFLELSAGAQYSKINKTYFNTYTASLNYYLADYWLSFRPYFFKPKTNNSSILYNATVRRYLNNPDNFISLTAGSGRSPDIADLLTVNFIVINNNFVTLNYQFPILNHQMFIDLGAGYQRWRYPSQLIRSLYDGKIGLKYRF